MREMAVTASLLLVLVVGVSKSVAQQISWPFEPGNSVYPIGNNYGQFQRYDTHQPERYLHDGLDLLSGGSRAVYAVAEGTVTHANKGLACGHNCGLAIGEPVAGGRGTIYWHIDGASIPFRVGDRVNTNDYVGEAYAPWPVPGFDHIHFSLARGTGGYPWEWFVGIENPLLRLNPNTDSSAPRFETIHNSSPTPFLFCRNETSDYLDPWSLSQAVDIIANIKDTFNDSGWIVAPYRVGLRIENVSSGVMVFERPFVHFSGEIGHDSDMLVDVLYKSDHVAQSEGNYVRREMFFVVTNSDGDSIIEPSDRDKSWDTTSVQNGEYRVTIEASDLSGNSARETMVVNVVN